MASSRIYENNGDGELEALYQAILGRTPFQYRAQDDPFYRSYADQYVQNGRMAMRDTMGSAAALTGGYGSSYAQAAGQQQYDEYLRLPISVRRTPMPASGMRERRPISGSGMP